ncbi:response regulator [Mobilibacterium timonense]|jgi:two-component system alkaline phosphatase synthesis response regulator PhoP|uniref:response regulator n=1 Tax=Mobilibacterium timonense TaxID=1871012 RepID=UPI00235605AF|nr:response regulator transcription factor [Mobilibacterium timonense]MBM6990966.1 response regulator transcription factor [Mobilibacterium timonense]
MIWCVEDDKDIREIEIYTLRSTGFEARGFEDGKSMLEALKEEKPELLLLDIMLPDVDGVSILKGIKSNVQTEDIPVIMATAKGMEYDKVQSLDLGADDYLVKPFGMMEMVSRIKAVLRRYELSKPQQVYKLDDLVLNEDTHMVTIGDERISLTLKEYEILKLFLSRPGMIFTREQLFMSVWGEKLLGDSRTIDVHIRTLRQKLGSYGDKIETVRGVGYRLEA